MKFLRNPEIRRELGLYLICDAVCAIAGLFYDSYYVCITAVIFTFLHFISSYRRYRKIKCLCKEIDSVLHGDYKLNFKDYAEGELSILGDELYKVITKINENEELLIKDRTRLTESIADISHQLRTPLTSINIVVTMLSKSDLDEEHKREHINRLNKLLSRTEWLVESLLKMSKLESKTAKFKEESIYLSEILQRAYEPLAVMMDLKNQKFYLDVKNEVFKGDMVWSVEAIGNILKNCMEHTPVDGRIEVIVSDTAVFTQILIRDTGEGFNREDIPHLFERFYKGKNASDNSFGIGLALSRMIITSQNGTIKAENWANGAQFTIKMYKSIV